MEKDQQTKSKSNKSTNKSQMNRSCNSARNNQSTNQKGNNVRNEYNIPKSDKNFDAKYMGKGNPIEFYVSNPQLAKDVASLPFSIMTGMPIDIWHASASKRSNQKQPCAPGILELKVVIGPGTSSTASDALNTAIRSIYTWVRHQNSGHTNYESADLGMYIMSMAEIYARYCELVRAYGVAMRYETENRYLPDALLKAMGFDPVDLRHNLAQFRAGLNRIASKIGSLCVPKVFTINARYAMLFSNIFTDSETKRGQFYVFRNAGYREFEFGGSTGGYLKWKPFALNEEGSYALSSITALDLMLDTILSDEDMNIMSGDILKAYGRENLITINGVDENYTVNPIYDVSILKQIDNACYEPVMQKDNTRYHFDIQQADGSMVYTPMVEITEAEYKRYNERGMRKYVLNNAFDDNTDFEFCIEATRLMPAYELMTVADAELTPHYYLGYQGGSDFVIDVRIHYFTSDSSGSRSSATINFPSEMFINPSSPGSQWSEFMQYILWSQAFLAYPTVYMRIGTQADAEIAEPVIPCCQLNKYTVLTFDTLRRIHETVMLSMLKTNLLT